MMTVRQILETKGRAVWSVSPDSSVYDAIKLMADKNVGALVVLDGDRLKGIISERDYARKVILKGKSSKEIPVNEIMSSNLITIRPEQSIEDCMALMTTKHIRHLPVLEANKLAGMISIGDVVKAIISEQEYTIKQLENYITGSR
ncbi:MAG: CBS domain-containing protein [Ignavibacteria bacterium]|nr:CBS domain-containing protein [Ignavibacteria bacterium]MBI3765649.1 CBS domain-containing protein [Ignavibacteriales bacterium]